MIRILPYDNLPATSNEFTLQQGERCTIMVSRLDGNDSVGEVFAFVQIKADGDLVGAISDDCQIEYGQDDPPELCRFTSVHTLDSEHPSITIEAASAPAVYRVMRQQCSPVIAIFRTEVISDDDTPHPHPAKCLAGQVQANNAVLHTYWDIFENYSPITATPYAPNRIVTLGNMPTGVGFVSQTAPPVDDISYPPGVGEMLPPLFTPPSNFQGLALELDGANATITLFDVFATGWWDEPNMYSLVLTDFCTGRVATFPIASFPAFVDGASSLSLSFPVTKVAGDTVLLTLQQNAGQAINNVPYHAGEAKSGTFTLTAKDVPARITAWPFEVDASAVTLYAVEQECGEVWIPLGCCGGELTKECPVQVLTAPGVYGWKLPCAEAPGVYLTSPQTPGCYQCPVQEGGGPD